MANDLQHCAACDEEYVAGVAACVECGGPLQPGPLERLEQRARSLTGAEGRLHTDAASAPPPPNRLLVELPGLQADHAVRALLLEDIACTVECQGIRKSYAAGQPPNEPFAMTLPVTIYVTDAQLDAAQDIVASFQTEDVIGDQWSDAGPLAEDDSVTDDPPREPAADDAPLEAGDSIPDTAPAPESTSLRTVVLIVLVAVVLLFLFGR